MGIFNELEDLKSSNQEIIQKHTKSITWVLSYLNEYNQMDWVDTVININFTPSVINAGYIIDSIINTGHRGSGYIFFRWKLVVDNIISYHGLNINPKTPNHNNNTTYANFSQININNTYEIKCSSNKIIILKQTDLLINHRLVLQIKHVGTNMGTRFNTSYSSSNIPKKGVVVSYVTVNEIPNIKMYTDHNQFQIYSI